MTEIIPNGQKEIFLKTLNKRGYLLEEKVQRLADNLPAIKYLGKNQVHDMGGDRVEIDLLFELNGYCFVVECKRTDFDWIFIREKNKLNHLCLIHDIGTDGRYFSNIKSTNISSSYCGFGVAHDGEKLKVKDNEVVTSHKDIRDAAKQLIRELQAVIRYQHFDIRKVLVPMIVTNANLSEILYIKEKISEKGDLTEFEETSNINYLIYNHPEMLFQADNIQAINPIGGFLERDAIKSVFVVNIEYFVELVTKITSTKAEAVISTYGQHNF